MKTFYTYMWLRNDGTPYYIGKGCGDRAFQKQGHRMNPPSPERILVQDYPSEQDAYAAERFLISYYGRKKNGTGVLWNLCDGGTGGPSGEFRTDKHQENLNASIVKANKERQWSEDARRRITLAGLLRGKETAARNKSRVWSESSRRKSAASKLGIPRPWSEERRARHQQRYSEMTQCKHGHPYTAENLYIAPTGGGRSCRICRDAALERRSQKERNENTLYI